MSEERRSAREIELEEEVKRLKKQLDIDDLTGAINGRGFNKEIKFLNQLTTEGLLKTAVLILADADNFKKYNDTHGHDFGDEVLRVVATTLQASGRKTDTAARIGGDEFALVLPGANAEIGTKIIQEIKNYLRIHTVEYEGIKEYVSVTMGMASFPETPLNQLKKVADLKMLQNKKDKGTGR